jgi:hypothetical protein
MTENLMPPKKLGARVCLVLSSGGAKLYGNRAAFASLAEWMNWLAHSPENEHFECHVVMDLEDDESKFDGKQPRNAWTLVSADMGPGTPEGGGDQRELTLMCLEERELDQLAQHQASGELPQE